MSDGGGGRDLAAPALLSAAVVGGVLLARHQRRADDADDVASASLAKAFLPYGDVTAADLRSAAAELRATGGDAELARAADEAAVMADARARPPPPGGERVWCTSASLCTLYAEPSIFSAYVRDVDVTQMTAVERTAAGWTRVVSPSSRPRATGSTVLGSTGWLRSDELTTVQPQATPAPALAGPDLRYAQSQTVKDLRALGIWLTSTQGQAVVLGAVGLVGISFPPLWFTIPYLILLRTVFEVALKFLLDTIHQVLLNKGFDEALTAAFLFQFGRLTSTMTAAPAILRNAGIPVPAFVLSNPRGGELGAAQALITQYSNYAFADAVNKFAKPAYLPQIVEALRLRTEADDLDLALQRLSFSPQQVAATTFTYATIDGVPTTVRVREDAIALAFNAQVGNRLPADLYSPDWYDPADGRFVDDGPTLRRLIDYEYARARTETDLPRRQLHFDRIKILQRQFAIASGAGQTGRTGRAIPLPKRRKSPAPPARGYITAAELLSSYHAARSRLDPNPLVVNALYKKYVQQLARENTQNEEERKRGLDARRASEANALVTVPTGAPVVLRPGPLQPVRSFLGTTLRASLITAPIWGSLLWWRATQRASRVRASRSAATAKSEARVSRRR